MSRFINPVPQYWLDDGSIASSGKMVFFENGDYSTKKNTYSQSDNTVPNTNPVTLDGQGRMPACFGEGLYSVKFYAYDNAAVDKLGTLQWTRDDVSLSELTGQFSAWNPLDTYLIANIARASDGNYYRSLIGGNIGNDPVSSPVQWELLVFITQYNPNRTYQINDNVVNAGLLYRANTADLIGIAPPAAQWDDLTFNDSVPGDFTIGNDLIVTEDASVGGDLTVTGEVYGGDLSKTTDIGIVKTAVAVALLARSSTTTLAADPVLTIPVTSLGYYGFKAIILWDGSSVTSNGIKVRINSGGGSVVQSIYIASVTIGANAAPVSNSDNQSPSGFSVMPSAGGIYETIIIEGVINITSTSNIYLEWSQAVSDPPPTNRRIGSVLYVTKLS